MRIYTKRHVLSGINIVPMLDILTILLIFFIVHTEFKHRTDVLKLDLPQTRSLAGEQGDENALLLELGADGRIAFARQEITPAMLPDTVEKIRRERPEARLQVSAAEGASMGRFIEIMDLLHEAGLQAEEVPVRIDYRP